MATFTEAFDAMLSGARAKIRGHSRTLHYSKHRQAIVQDTEDYGELPWLFNQGQMFAEWEILRMEEDEP